MKKLLALCILCLPMALTACAGTDGEADYTYESMAPYADERTVGDNPEPTAERVFERRMRK